MIVNQARWGVCLLIILVFISYNSAFAATQHNKLKKAKKTNIPVYSSLIVDSSSGKILHAHNASKPVFPASLTKLMTLVVLFDKIQEGKLSLNSHLKISQNATNMKPCKLGLTPGETITVRQAIEALIVKSANDVAVAVAENVAGSESLFANMMNAKARNIGMLNTTFKNASGWHHPAQKTTAKDLAKLAIAIKHNYSKFYPMFSQTNFTFKGKLINGHNHVTANYPWSEGLKTGYTHPSGYNLVTTASKNNTHLVGVITGGNSSKARDKQMVSLLERYLNTQGKIQYKSAKGAKNTISR